MLGNVTDVTTNYVCVCTDVHLPPVSIAHYYEKRNCSPSRHPATLYMQDFCLKGLTIRLPRLQKGLEATYEFELEQTSAEYVFNFKIRT